MGPTELMLGSQGKKAQSLDSNLVLVSSRPGHLCPTLQQGLRTRHKGPGLQWCSATGCSPNTTHVQGGHLFLLTCCHTLVAKSATSSFSRFTVGASSGVMPARACRRPW